MITEECRDRTRKYSKLNPSNKKMGVVPRGGYIRRRRNAPINRTLYKVKYSRAGDSSDEKCNKSLNSFLAHLMTPLRPSVIRNKTNVS